MAALLPIDAACVVEVGPIVDNVDFISLENAVAWNAAGMNLYWYKKTATALTASLITLTSGGANDWAFKQNGMYEVNLAAAQADTLGVSWLVGIATGFLVFESARYQVVPQNVFDSWVLGTDYLKTDAVEISSSAQAADNFEEGAESMTMGTVDNTVFTATTVEFECDDITEATPNHFNGQEWRWRTGAMAKQATAITAYSLSAGRGHFTVNAMTEAPADDDKGMIV